MRHGKVTRNLGVKSAHRSAMLRNLLRGLLRDGRIRTTVARAKVLRPYVEKLVTKLKDPSVHNMRQAYSVVNDRDTLHTIAHDVATKFKTRNGGYLRILKLARSRPGDNADMALVEWVDEDLVNEGLERRKPVVAKPKTEKKAKKAAKTADETSDAASKKTKKAPKKSAKK